MARFGKVLKTSQVLYQRDHAERILPAMLPQVIHFFLPILFRESIVFHQRPVGELRLRAHLYIFSPSWRRST